MNIPADHIVAFVGADAIPALGELLSDQATIKNYSADSAWEIQNHIQDRLPLISQKNAEILSTRIGSDLLLLENEIQKLALLPSISEADILENTIESIEVNMFALLDSIMLGNVGKSKGLFQKYLAQFEDYKFINLFLSAMRKPGLYAGLVGNGIPPKMAADACDLKDFAARKYLAIPMNRLRSF